LSHIIWHFKESKSPNKNAVKPRTQNKLKDMQYPRKNDSGKKGDCWWKNWNSM